MKINSQHFSCLVLALMVLVSTQSFSINAHYCGNILVDKALMKPAKKCAMHIEHSHSNPENESEKEDCCNDEVELIQGQNELQVQDHTISLPNPIFVEAFVYTFVFNLSIENTEKQLLFESPPPLLRRDFQSFYQVYLI